MDSLSADVKEYGKALRREQSLREAVRVLSGAYAAQVGAGSWLVDYSSSVLKYDGDGSLPNLADFFPGVKNV